ncbi:MAG: D-alanyl-D-alanine carboxypeptidase family protein [Bacillota bacterium]|nr:D-alanyl-D-alanine carboxypeptidase family protein [Bacillota bacterium]
MKKLLSVLFLCVLFIVGTIDGTIVGTTGGAVSMVFADSETEETDIPDVAEPKLEAEAYLLILKNSGQVLASKNPDRIMYPASLTKIMTALVVLDKVKNLDERVTIDEKSPFIEGTKIYLSPGEQISVRDLLYALILVSGNDAASALAVHVAGGIDEFALMMNDMAMKLGCKNTNFVNPHGLHDDAHYTTANDLYIIAKAAMDVPVFAEIASSFTHVVEPTNKQPEQRVLYSTNALIKDAYLSYELREDLYGNTVNTYYEFANGVKNGYTDQAGFCLVSSATYGKNTVFAVVLKTEENLLFEESAKLLEYGLFGFRDYDLKKAGEVIGTYELRDSQKTVIELVPILPLTTMLKAEPKDGEITYVTNLKKNITLPIRKGEPLGTIEAFKGDVSLGSIEIAANADISGRALLDDNLEVFSKGFRFNFWKLLLYGMEIVVMFFVVIISAYHLGLHPNSPQWRRRKREQRAGRK